ncbi:GumC family protein [Stutzerimonas nitrititolerans]|uniref:non-specific protein-tyrosine kinase n=1 Tax=Stutzerimonas nitrititolerans TaxID=2482751 RepID=A0AA42BDN5_9GAMM|nr:polysaccharide biosynthesis tyrosine autokinase [Stutzerimonas nitrititolerans]AFN77148.1 capsular exopolysaccharide family protein [Stutzerimonas stutzeri DSM 10701]KRW73780.1 lipopolysaccharide biosynthesis protein [Pseudomonas sp. TTU2014-066ASC]SUD83756.1 capsular exopolysaccharide family protein [Stutzerimonas stutzeri]HAQ72763.1 lipopolysaccharide biosynthesis protein [Pseudomonas sp.]MCO7545547.1 polysaccharide biosynthesis tyrosine autokinase [Stutzerimonas nitrititolerans]
MNSPVRPDRPWQRSTSTDDSDFIDLKKIWHAVWSRKWGIVLLVAVVAVLMAVLLSRMTPIYKAVTSVIIEVKGTPVVSFQPANAPTEVSEYLQTQLSLIQSRGVAEKVVRDLELTEHPEFDLRQQPGPLIDIGGMLDAIMGEEPEPLTEAQIMDHATQVFMDRTTVWVEGKSQLVYLSVAMADKLMAAQAANHLATSYIEAQLEAKVEMSMTAASWMNTRLVDLRQNLKDSEDRLQAYLDAEGLVDMDGVGTISANELSLTGDRMIDARRQRAEAESQFRQVESMRDQGWERLASVPAVLGHPLIQQFKADRAHARSRVEDLSRRYGDRHPAMQSARSDLNAATASLRQQVEQVVASIERSYQLAVANENSLRASFNDNKEQIQDISRKEFKVRDLQREVEANRALYDTFMTRLQETTATSDLSSTNARIVDEAIPPAQASEPNTRLFMVVALFLALVVGIAQAIIREILDNTFKSSDEVETKLNLPVMGIVPQVPRNLRKQVSHLFQRNEEKRFCEAIRTIRTNITLTEGNQPRQVLVVTSTAPGEGKSSVSANLAFAMGQLNRVLLIDADLRRATLDQTFEFAPGTPGLANLIGGNAKLDDCIRSVGNVDMISAGTVPSNPLELLSSPRFAKLLEAVKGRYDRIIIDSPPSQAVSDAAVLSILADAVIYVIKSESTLIPHAQKGVAQLLQSNAPVAGVVLNHVDVEKAKRNGQFRGYYDHYGYSEQTV